MGTVVRSAAVIVLLWAGALAATAATAAAATQPIQGVWSFQNGQVNIQQTSPDQYTGTVVAATQFAKCSHPVGQVIWNITGSGLHYTGTHVWATMTCAPLPGGKATWTITQTDPTDYTLTFCTAYPGYGAPDPSASPGNPVGVTQCFALTRTVAPTQTPSPPSNTTPPSAAGGGAAGSTLTCTAGAWTNDPSGYTYQWYRDGTPIAGATSPTYTVQAGDEGLTVTCAVTAYNLGGAGGTATSTGVVVSVPVVARCPAATGSLSGTRLGKIKLGMTRKQARQAYSTSTTRGSKFKDFFCLTPVGLRVGYASTSLVKRLPKKQRAEYTGRVVWASTSNARYAAHGIRTGATLKAAEKALKLGKPLHVGKNYWYLAVLRSSTIVLKAPHGTVEEIGIANKQLTRTRRQQAVFMRSFY